MASRVFWATKKNLKIKNEEFKIIKSISRNRSKISNYTQVINIVDVDFILSKLLRL